MEVKFQILLFYFSIYIGNLFADVKEELVISQATFREICSHFFNKAISLIKRALMDAKINPKEIDEVYYWLLFSTKNIKFYINKLKFC